MCIVHYCGHKSILPFETEIDQEILDRGLQLKDQNMTALSLKKLISLRTKVPLDHLKIYEGKEMVLMDDRATIDATSQLYFTVTTCKNPKHCPSQVRIVTLFGQFRAPFTQKTTVLELKRYVQKAMGIPPDQQRFKFQGRILEDSQILSEQQVIDGSELRLDPKTKGA